MFAPVFTGSRNLHRVIAVALATRCSFSVVASEPVVDESLVVAEVVALSIDSNVVVTPIPVPASVLELATTANRKARVEASVGQAFKTGQKQAATENHAIADETASNGPFGTKAKEWGPGCPQATA
jgi:hypothetical protein